MKTLIVDDQYQDKAQTIAKILRDIGHADCEIVVSVKSALKKLQSETYDLLVVDLQLPVDDGEDADINGGKQLLEMLDLNSKLHKPKCVLGITAHHEAYEKSVDFFKNKGWSLVLGADDEALLTSILKTQSLHLSYQEARFDIAIITALTHTELEAILKLPCEWAVYQHKNDFNIYHTGKIVAANGSVYSVIATSCPRMGMSSAAAVAATVCERFSPKLVVMTGIAAGIEGKVKLGDILVADSCWDWGSGKMTVRKGKPVFLSAPTQISLDPAIRSKFIHLAVTNEYMNEIYAGWREGKRPPEDPKMHVGPIATGAVVLEDPTTVQLIIQQNRNTVGVEMEAFGIMTAAQNASCRPKVLIVKSVCDYADPAKNNDWQKYAAYTSAAIAFRYIRDHFAELT